jgi:hypothetical protein
MCTVSQKKHTLCALGALHSQLKLISCSSFFVCGIAAIACCTSAERGSLQQLLTSLCYSGLQRSFACHATAVLARSIRWSQRLIVPILHVYCMTHPIQLPPSVGTVSTINEGSSLAGRLGSKFSRVKARSPCVYLFSIENTFLYVCTLLCYNCANSTRTEQTSARGAGAK